MLQKKMWDLSRHVQIKIALAIPNLMKVNEGCEDQLDWFKNKVGPFTADCL